MKCDVANYFSREVRREVYVVVCYNFLHTWSVMFQDTFQQRSEKRSLCWSIYIIMAPNFFASMACDVPRFFSREVILQALITGMIVTVFTLSFY